ncbi:DUF998 domain-containing protein [Streptomyces flavofungini]|uniref:DUF998 domain-containing protein n=1 Tax=Streptomyces flavofungini TaxID=68200 RepID=A0ABS0XAF7_9ACTN|nr:DUF998 domain-containing protein [Streptomyces flavofungini]MBJ3809986.1 DUF998 domain-containing protein [Streptomyces flavofungini]GHC53603.1 hypothetical protein GCM10010349_19750 [Streptomyces flavofungini]
MAPTRKPGRGCPGLAVLALFLLAPFVGEFLLGNLTVPQLGLGVLLAPLYGCGALLVREVGRRTGGWPTMVLLAAAYALIEEGPVDQLLWNDSYAGQDLVHGPSFVPGPGTSVELVQAVLALHTVWSVCVPIALVEACVPARRTTPWLGRRGLAVTSVVYVLGASLVFWGNYTEEHFIAPPAQLAVCVVAIVALVVVALRIPRDHPKAPNADTIAAAAALGPAPAPWRVGALALAGTSLYWGPSVLLTADWFEWIGVALWFLVAVGGALAVARWSRRPGWGARHVCALAGGALLTYVWAAFPVRPEDGGSLTADLVSNAVCAALALAVLARAVRTARAEQPEGGIHPPGPSRSAQLGARSYGG